MVVSRPLVDGIGLGAGVEEDEGAGAVSGFDHARREAGLADQGGLLVAGDAADGDGGAEQRRVGGAEVAGAVADFREHGGGDAEEAEHLRVPFRGGEVAEEGAGGVCGVGGEDAAGGEAPEEVGVDGAEGEFAGFGAAAGAGDSVEDPGDLGGGEIRVQAEAGAAGDFGVVAVAGELVAEIGGAAVLPDDGVVDRVAGGAVPDEGGFALVGDADGGDAGVGLGQGGAGGGEGGGPEVCRVVLDPAGVGVVLGEFFLGLG